MARVDGRSFQSMWTQLIGGKDTGGVFGSFTLAISPKPTGGVVTGGGLACGTGGTACSVTFASSTSVTLTAAADASYSFTGWGGACSGTSTTTTVMVDSAKTCTAAFTLSGPPPATYALAVSPAPMNGTVSGGGLTCGAGGAVCQVDVASGTSVTLTATPMSGYSLTNWGGSCSGTGTTTTVLMSAARTCTATFAVGLPTGPPYTMTISPKPTGGTIAGAGLNCGTGGNLCAVTMPASMGLGMSAAPDAGYNFGAWTGDCSGLTTSLTVQLSGPRTCSATFIPVGTTFQLNVSPAPTGGTVTGGGITCGTGGSTCQVTYGSATSVVLSAAPASGFTFTGWGGSCAGTGTSTTIQVDGIRTCTAAFAATPTYQLNVSPAPAGGTVTGGGITCGTGGSTCQATYGSSAVGHADGGAGLRVHIHELGGRLRRHGHQHDRAGERRQDLQRHVHGRPGQRPAVHDDYQPGAHGGHGHGRGPELRHRRQPVRGDDAAAPWPSACWPRQIRGTPSRAGRATAPGRIPPLRSSWRAAHLRRHVHACRRDHLPAERLTAPTGGTVSGRWHHVRHGRRGVPGDLRHVHLGDADSDAGLRLHVHELGRQLRGNEREHDGPGGRRQDVHGRVHGGADLSAERVAGTGGRHGDGGGITCGTGGLHVPGDVRHHRPRSR